MKSSSCTVTGCASPRLARGLCRKHYKRLMKHGSPYAGVTRDVQERFWRSVEKSPDCWLWTGSKNADGYGRIYVAGTYQGVHRYAHELLRGPIPSGLLVCHSCDNPACVNPAHLWLGTQLDNMRDMAAKGRASREPRVQGEQHPGAKPTLPQVRAIRRLKAKEGVTHSRLASMFGVSISAIGLITQGKRWA